MLYMAASCMLGLGEVAKTDRQWRDLQRDVIRDAQAALCPCLAQGAVGALFVQQWQRKLLVHGRLLEGQVRCIRAILVGMAASPRLAACDLRLALAWLSIQLSAGTDRSEGPNMGRFRCHCSGTRRAPCSQGGRFQVLPDIMVLLL
jgi:hypothetical protein